MTPWRRIVVFKADKLEEIIGVVNIPAMITVPLWETLVTEMRKAKDRNLPFDFGHYIMICKLFKSEAEDEGPETKQVVTFSNPEEELIVAESELCIDYEV